MRRHIVALLSILAVVAGVGWKLASHPETSTGLQEIRLSRHSERSHPGPSNALAGIRIRLSGSDLREVNATHHEIPQVSLAAE